MVRKPLISVIMPAYNAERYIESAIESVLHQTMQDFELLIMSDASTDKTLSIIQKYRKKDKRIRVIKNKENLQIAVSLNRLVDEAQSECIARMDADDIAFPNRLELQHQLLQRSKKIAVVGANMIIVDKDDQPISKRDYPATDKELRGVMFRYSPFGHPVVMFRKSIFQKVGGYTVSMVPCEDIDLWFKIGNKYGFASVPQPLIYYRIGQKSNSNKNLRQLELLGFKIKLQAIHKYGYHPSLYDVVYNVGQFVTLWFMPEKLRVWTYNMLRSRKLI